MILSNSEENCAQYKANMMENKINLIKFKFTMSCISAVTKPAYGSPFKLVNVKTIAFLYLDVSMPVAAAPSPVETDFSVNDLSNACWMRAT